MSGNTFGAAVVHKGTSERLMCLSAALFRIQYWTSKWPLHMRPSQGCTL